MNGVVAEACAVICGLQGLDVTVGIRRAARQFVLTLRGFPLALPAAPSIFALRLIELGLYPTIGDEYFDPGYGNPIPRPRASRKYDAAAIHETPTRKPIKPSNGCWPPIPR